MSGISFTLTLLLVALSSKPSPLRYDPISYILLQDQLGHTSGLIKVLCPLDRKAAFATWPWLSRVPIVCTQLIFLQVWESRPHFRLAGQPDLTAVTYWPIRTRVFFSPQQDLITAHSPRFEHTIAYPPTCSLAGTSLSLKSPAVSPELTGDSPSLQLLAVTHLARSLLR